MMKRKMARLLVMVGLFLLCTTFMIGEVETRAGLNTITSDTGTLAKKEKTESQGKKAAGKDKEDGEKKNKKKKKKLNKRTKKKKNKKKKNKKKNNKKTKKKRKQKKKTKKKKKKKKVLIEEEGDMINLPGTDIYRPEQGDEKTRKEDKDKKEKDNSLVTEGEKKENEKKKEEKQNEEILDFYYPEYQNPTASNLYTVYADVTNQKGSLVYQAGREVNLPKEGFIGYKKTGENNGVLLPLSWAGKHLDTVKQGKQGSYVLQVTAGGEVLISEKNLGKLVFYVLIEIK